MSGRKLSHTSLGFIVGLVLSSGTLFADPITVEVNAARIYVVGGGQPEAIVGVWHQSGTSEGAVIDVSVSGDLLDPQLFLNLCNPCSSGDTFSPSIVLSGDPIGVVTMLLPERVNDLSASGELRLEAGSIVLPAEAPELFNVFLPLTLSGFLAASQDGEVLLRVQPFSFTGTAFVQFRTGEGPLGTRVFTAQALDYVGADSPAPVPEPASMVLLGTGLTGLMLRRWKRARENDGRPPRD